MAASEEPAELRWLFESIGVSQIVAHVWGVSEVEKQVIIAVVERSRFDRRVNPIDPTHHSSNSLQQHPDRCKHGFQAMAEMSPSPHARQPWYAATLHSAEVTTCFAF